MKLFSSVFFILCIIDGKNIKGDIQGENSKKIILDHNFWLDMIRPYNLTTFNTFINAK